MNGETVPLRPEDLLEHIDWIRKLARALVRDPAEAEDLAQEATAVALDSPPAADRPVRPWLAGVMRNLSRMRARGAARARRREEASVEPTVAAGTAELVERVEMHRLISELVVSLGEPMRTVVLLRYYEGLSAPDIARRLGIADGTVRWRLKQALDGMRTTLDQKHAGDRARWCGMLAPIASAPGAVSGHVIKGALAVKTVAKIAASVVALVLALLLTGHFAGWWSEAATKTAGATGPAEARAPGARTGEARAGVAMQAVAGPGGLVFAEKEADPPGSLRLEGQVIDERDQPVAGAIVAIDSAPPRTTRTEADGSFEFEGLLPRAYEVEAREGERFAGPASVELHAAVEPLILRAAVGARLRVVVRSESGEPVSGAEVELRSTLMWSARTDVEGVAVLSGVGPGWRTLAVRADGYAPASRMITQAPSSADKEVEIQLARGASVAGRVLSGQGKPIAGARVWATSVSEPFPVIDPRLDAVVTREDGTWRMAALPAGSFRFSAAAASYAETTSAPFVFDGGTPRDDVELRMDEGGTIAGRVVDLQGAPVAGATVRATGVGRVWWGLARETATDASGAFRLSGLPRRRFEIVARKADAASELAIADLATKTEVDATISLAIAGAIAGVVVDGERDPVADARVMIEPVWTGGRDERSRWWARGIPMASAGRDGAFRIGGLPAGNYRVRASRPGAEVGLLELHPGVEASPGGPSLTVAIPSETVVTGKVALADGTPPGPFSIEVGGVLQQPFAARDGRFALAVTAGVHNVVVSGPSIMTKVVPDVRIGAEEETDVGTITVERGRSVSGTVVDSEGAPVAGAKVAAGRLLTGGGSELNISSEGFGVQEAETDAAGRFVMSGFDERSVVVIAQHDRRGRSASVRIPGGAASAEVSLVLSPTGSLAGRARKGGAPLAESVVIANPVGASQQNFFVVTGADGSFAFDQLAPGEYTVMVMLGQGGGKPKDMHVRSVQVAAGERSAVDIDVVEGPIEVALEARVEGGGPVAIAQVFLGQGSFAAQQTTFEQMRERKMVGDSGAFYVRAQMFGQPARVAGLAPGSYSACALAIPADPKDQNAMQRMFERSDLLPLRCVDVGRLDALPKEPIVISVPADWVAPK